jgi:hemoglobin
MSNPNDGMRGSAAIDAAVERFQERVSADPELAGYFEGMDMRRILMRQMTLFALVAGPAPQFARAGVLTE